MNLDVILLDFSKAFDRVAHMRLCHKLAHLGIKGSLLKWIECILSDRMQHVIVNGERSLDSRVISGVATPRKCAGAAIIFVILMT